MTWFLRGCLWWHYTIDNLVVVTRVLNVHTHFSLLSNNSSHSPWVWICQFHVWRTTRHSIPGTELNTQTGTSCLLPIFIDRIVLYYWTLLLSVAALWAAFIVFISVTCFIVCVMYYNLSCVTRKSVICLITFAEKRYMVAAVCALDHDR